MADLSKFTDADLDALAKNDLTGLSDQALAHLESLHQEAPAGPDTTSMAGRFWQGVKDPFMAAGQLMEKVPVPTSGRRAVSAPVKPEDTIDAKVRSQEKAYQQSRGEEGGKFDIWRAAGNVLNPATAVLGAAAPVGAGLGWLGRAALAAGTGAVATPALTPVTSGEPEDFWNEKGKQAAVGTAAGAVMSPVTSALSRVINPQARQNPQLHRLMDEGVIPSIGQTLGGTANRMEERMTSLPFVGDAITAARNRGQDTFENAFINRSQRPIGRHVEGSGFDAINEAHTNVSQALDAAEQAIQHWTPDAQFQTNLLTLQQMTSGLTPPLQRKFNQMLDDHVLGKLNPQTQAMTGETFATAISDLGTEAEKALKNKMASSQDYGNAIKQLRQELIDTGYRVNPQAAELHQNAREAYANLMRLEDAARAAGNNSGHFSPAQANNAVKNSMGQKTRFARGQAFGQDLTDAGQAVLGNRVPDSGTAGRLGALMSLMHPASVIPLLGGTVAYSPALQQALRAAVLNRPAAAVPVAGALSRAAPRLVAPTGMALSQPDE